MNVQSARCSVRKVGHRVMRNLPQKGTVWEFGVDFRGAGKERYPFIVI